MMSAVSQKTTRLDNAGLCVLLAGMFLPQIDFSIINVALDSVARSLHATEYELELMVAVYGVAFAVVLAMGGRLGDMYGRRRLFNIGVLLFGISSLLCGIAPGIYFLLLARTLQGVAAALLVPQILATIHVCLKGHAHSRAIGLYSSIGGLSFIIGQVLGGFLVHANLAGTEWRSIFLINLPVCALVLALSPRHLPETCRQNPAGIDGPGTVLLAMLIISILVPVALGPSFGWNWLCLLTLASALPLAIALWKTEIRQERRGVLPLLPPTLLRLPTVRFGFFTAVVFFACWSGFMFVLALTLQAGAGLTPLQSGNSFIALGVAFFIGSLLSTRVTASIGLLPTLLLGCAMVIPGLFLLLWVLQQVWPAPNLLSLTIPSLFIGIGQAFIVGAFYRIGMSQIPADQAGSGSAMLSTIQQASMGLGPALLGAVFSQSLLQGHDYQRAIHASVQLEIILLALLMAVSTWYFLRQRSQARVAVRGNI
ncbi:MFS transporter [Advenella sp. S44]|uniref:MFS transporter n=1 Tax=Advenella sp. S44 TaxID=1982755 RepID=UPI000CAEDD1E|nr:MFS transporter [Advenella sp. S44]PJX22972.1 MFS transporter [Advenella sp. S44]